MGLIAIINITKLEKPLGSLGIIHVLKLIMNLCNKTYSNYQCNKNKKPYRLVKSCLYNKAHNDYQYKKNKDFSSYSFVKARHFSVFVLYMYYLILTITNIFCLHLVSNIYKSC